MDDKQLSFDYTSSITKKVSTDRFQRDFERFERSIRDIDSKFGQLEVNLQKYRDITDSTRQELLLQQTE